MTDRSKSEFIGRAIQRMLCSAGVTLSVIGAFVPGQPHATTDHTLLGGIALAVSSIAAGLIVKEKQ